MRALKFGLGLIAATTLMIGAPQLASADSTHICQGHNNCNDDGGHGGGKGGGHGRGHGGDQELECSNESGDSLITVLANVCPQDFPILVDIL